MLAWLGVWDSRTVSLSLASATSVILVPANPAREARGEFSARSRIVKAVQTLPSFFFLFLALHFS